MNYYISDLHIGHANIIAFDNRPFADITAMNNAIIENWNSRIKTDDTVYILGDFIWAKESDWPYFVKPLAGNKVLIRGNHDPREFSRAVRNMFCDITNLKEIKDNCRHVVICHYPIPFYRAGYYGSNSYMLYGHVHKTKEYEYLKDLRKNILSNSKGPGNPSGNFINVGCMMPYMNYTPRTLDEIIEGDKLYRQTTEYLNDNICRKD